VGELAHSASGYRASMESEPGANVAAPPVPPAPVGRVLVFCGSGPGRRPEYMTAAAELGRRLAAEGLGTVYGGASVGMMGAVADGALGAGGEVTGVIPRQLVDRELAHPGLSELHVVASMHERKALMLSLADAVVALPGGAGTMDELFEVLTWSQLGLHEKPVGLLNIAGYYTSLLGFLDHAVNERLLRAQQRDSLIVADAVAELIPALRARLESTQ
jgi:uncharacterized protein (TIGR00730 family)